MIGNGSFFADPADFEDFANLVIPTLCNHNGLQIFAFVEAEDDDLHVRALQAGETISDYVAAIAALSPGMFQRALTITSVGCDRP